MMSEIKVRSLGELTLGTTRVVRLGDCRISVRSGRARPEETELMRTARSLTLGGRAWSRALRTRERASSLRFGVTESSRS